jgi:hypothetical protein
MEVSADLERLRSMIAVPPGVSAARWVVERLGNSGGSFLPGPTDLRLLALLRPVDDNGWHEFEATLGPAAGECALTLSADVAHALLGTDTPSPDGDITVTGQAYDATKLSSPQFRAATALRAGGGVLVSAVSS